MIGVDLSDQHLSYHSLSKRKTIKWWKKLFWRLIDICILNASIVFRVNNPNSKIKTNRQFRLALMLELTEPMINATASGESRVCSRGRRPRAYLSRLNGKHSRTGTQGNEKDVLYAMV